MNMTQCAILFAILFILIIIAYLIIYHKYEKKVAAVIVAAIASVVVLASSWFIMPFPNRASVEDMQVSAMRIDTSRANNYAVCDDGTEYRINAVNSMRTTGFDAYKNNSEFANVKVTVKYRYDYKLWWVIPAYSTSEVIMMYMDGNNFYDMYGCRLDEAAIITDIT